ncbi:hypothetical protein C8R43DRAFT_1119261 [Mycena crocata]|nr:hypothetical protein C8R43DRAFT_1125161 [Mycena crocata]KAJ7175248.1 hypothetical protein C8R43DRAFT_1119261 [Mycena crocata]
MSVSTAPLDFGDLQRGERYSNMNYFVSQSFLSQLILVYDGCYQLHLPTEYVSKDDHDYDDLPDLEPGVTSFLDFNWAKKRQQLHVRAKL